MRQSYQARMVASLFAAISLTAARPARSAELQQRVGQYYEAWRSGDAEAIWGLLSPEAKNGVEVKGYIQNFKVFAADTRLESFQIKKLQQGNGKLANVEAVLVLLIESEGKAKHTISHKTSWVLINSGIGENWYLADQVESEIESTPPPPEIFTKRIPEKPLYDRLGGKKGITAVVDEFVARVVADKRINAFFAKANVPKLKKNLVDQICQAAGGPCKYTGKNMKEAHKGMGISGADFDAFVEDLIGALDKVKVGEKEKAELLGALGPMKSDRVQN